MYITSNVSTIASIAEAAIQLRRFDLVSNHIARTHTDDNGTVSDSSTQTTVSVVDELQRFECLNRATVIMAMSLSTRESLS